MLTAVGLTFAGCAVQQQKPPMTPLEIQSIQTREFESPKKIVFASVVSVFQDLGYTLKNADLNTGFINAESAAQNSTATIGEGIFVEILGEVILGDVAGSNQSTQSTEQTAATAFIEEIGDRTRVRLNFVTTETIVLSPRPEHQMGYSDSGRQDLHQRLRKNRKRHLHPVGRLTPSNLFDIPVNRSRFFTTPLSARKGFEDPVPRFCIRMPSASARNSTSDVRMKSITFSQ